MSGKDRKLMTFRRHFEIVPILCMTWSADSIAEVQAINPTLTDKFRVELGVYLSNTDFRVSSVVPGQPPDELDLSRLGLPGDETTAWLGATWRPSERWLFKINYVNVSENGSASADRDFSFGTPPDEVDVTAGATVTTDIETRLYVAQAGYYLRRTDRSNLAVGLGLHALDAAVTLTGEVSVGDVSTSLGAGKSDTLAPLPNIQFYGDYAFTPKLSLTGSVGWFGLEVDKWDGNLVTVSVDLEYRPFDRVGFGLGYELIDMDLDVDETDSFDSYDIEYSGPRLMLTVAF